MPGKQIKLIGKTIHPDGYYTATSISTTSNEASQSEATSATVSIKRPHIKLWYRLDKGIFIGPEQREKLIREEEEELQAAKEEIPTPGFVLLVKESVEEAKTTRTTTTVSTTHHPISDDYSCSTFQSKLDATKRKMQDSYQQLANAKKQKRIQVIDPRDLPPPTTTTQSSSSSKGKGGAVAARKKMFNISTTTNRKTMSSNNNLFNGGRSRLVKPTSIF